MREFSVGLDRVKQPVDMASKEHRDNAGWGLMPSHTVLITRRRNRRFQ
jgi:hypothetical protein